MSATIASLALFLLFFLCINSPFDFSSNNHSGQIPRGLRGCTKLEIFEEGSNSDPRFHLSCNYLGRNISLLFSSNGWPNSSQIVDISSNDSNGMIQASFFQLARNFTKLNVSNNSFTGPIPSLPCINSPFVMILDFASNNHSGQFHSGLGGCSKLEVPS
ncbi:hypothetical protein CMV_016279 [Castanea mollissima]|uniref:Uncharacterized protein n=1 Tax=Castanea mollissima TaxID=60419 RepID=A0A8J4QSZ9_9ROSI|nr:hypothetical protein CMV_016279 [Castanea mollissima]